MSIPPRPFDVILGRGSLDLTWYQVDFALKRDKLPRQVK